METAPSWTGESLEAVCNPAAGVRGGSGRTLRTERPRFAMVPHPAGLALALRHENRPSGFPALPLHSLDLPRQLRRKRLVDHAAARTGLQLQEPHGTDAIVVPARIIQYRI